MPPMPARFAAPPITLPRVQAVAAEPLIVDAVLVAPDPADAAPAAPVLIDYAGRVTQVDPLRRDAARALVPLAVLSGLCVAAAWGAIASENALGLVHVAVFGLTVWSAVRVGMRLRRAGAPVRSAVAFDGAALAGLVVVGLAPIGYAAWNDAARTGGPGPLGLSHEAAVGILGLGYLAMGLTSCRHVWMYAELARWADDLYRRRLGRSLRALGWVKAVFETLWLGACCGATLVAVAADADGEEMIVLAVGALVGCVGYGAIWIWMISAHATLARAHSRGGGA